MSKSSMSRISRRTGLLAAALSLALPVGLVAGALSGASVASAAETPSQTFTFSDATQYFTVPVGVYNINLVASGGAGGGGDQTAGKGATITESVPVNPGDTLVVEVGGAGAPGGTNNTVSGGGAGGLSSGDAMNGGAGGGVNFLVDGDSGGGGGGGTQVVDATTNTILVVAGGGGGGGGNGSSGGVPGAGGPGGSAVDNGAFTTTGGQATAPYGGQGGAGGLSAATGVPAGANGGTPKTGALAGGGGGGGGGYAGPGGGGGGNGGAGGGWASYEGGGGGGGGGDSYVPDSATGISMAPNATGNGHVTVSWTTPPAPTTTSLSISPNGVTVGRGYTLSATVTSTGPVPATGSVSFESVDGESVGATLSGTNPDVATASVTAPDITGAVTWQAEYEGDTGASGQPGDAPSNSQIISEAVLAAPTSTKVSVSEDPLTTGQHFSITATVTGTGPTKPKGVVDFYRTGGPTLTGTLSGGTPDVATVTATAPTSPETIVLAAQYEGDTANAGSAAPTVEVPVDLSVLKPSLTGASPSQGGVGTKVILHGKNLDKVTKVLFGTTAAKVFSCASATTCSAVAPKGVTSKVDLQVITPSGKSNANPSVTFTYESGR